MADMIGEGTIYTTGSSFRALAEARQRWYRKNILKEPAGEYGHYLVLRDPPVLTQANFVSDIAYQAARRRVELGKGVAIERTFGNMLSSQAMCFNLFGPLSTAANRELAARLLRQYVAGLASVQRILLEYTPTNDIFGDQEGLGGVDCDVLIEFRDEIGRDGILVVETKFVESEFSVCKPWKLRKCPHNVMLGEKSEGCYYTSKKGYRYWEQAYRFGTVARSTAQAIGCPFGGPLWQLWVNHTLAHAIAAAKQPYPAARALFAVCAPRANNTLLRGGSVIRDFAGLLTDPSTAFFMAVEDLVGQLVVETRGSAHEHWARGLEARYVIDATGSSAPVD